MLSARVAFHHTPARTIARLRGTRRCMGGGTPCGRERCRRLLVVCGSCSACQPSNGIAGAARCHAERRSIRGAVHPGGLSSVRLRQERLREHGATRARLDR